MEIFKVCWENHFYLSLSFASACLSIFIIFNIKLFQSEKTFTFFFLVRVVFWV